jgi:hypothetical protein
MSGMRAVLESSCKPQAYRIQAQPRPQNASLRTVSWAKLACKSLKACFVQRYVEGKPRALSYDVVSKISFETTTQVLILSVSRAMMGCLTGL